jgi:hypothetical protein
MTCECCSEVREALEACDLINPSGILPGTFEIAFY